MELEAAKRNIKPMKVAQSKAKCRKNLTNLLKRETKMDSSSSEEI